MENNQNTGTNPDTTGNTSNQTPAQDGNRKETDPKNPAAGKNDQANSDTNRQQAGFNRQQDQPQTNPVERNGNGTNSEPVEDDEEDGTEEEIDEEEDTEEDVEEPERDTDTNGNRDTTNQNKNLTGNKF